MKSGWLVVNNFIDSEKFKEIYALFLNAAKKIQTGLELKRAGEILREVGGYKREKLPDFVLFWDKDVVLAEMLELAGVRVFNSSAAIAACDDKRKTAVLLEKHGVPFPKTVVAPKTFEGIGYCDTEFLKTALGIVGLPAVIKEAYGSFGQQVYLARNLKEAEKTVKNAGCKELLFQKFIAESAGRDVRVNIIGGRAVCAMARENADDFRSNISGGGKAAPYVLDGKTAAVAEAACRAVGADFAGVDLLFGDDGPSVCEVNSNPHFKSTLDCTGIDLSEIILEFIRDELR